MENFETENSQISNDTPRMMDFNQTQIQRKTIDQNDTVPLRPSLKRRIVQVSSIPAVKKKDYFNNSIMSIN